MSVRVGATVGLLFHCSPDPNPCGTNRLSHLWRNVVAPTQMEFSMRPPNTLTMAVFACLKLGTQNQTCSGNATCASGDPTIAPKRFAFCLWVGDLHRSVLTRRWKIRGACEEVHAASLDPGTYHYQPQFLQFIAAHGQGWQACLLSRPSLTINVQ